MYGKLRMIGERARSLLDHGLNFHFEVNAVPADADVV